MGCLQQLIDMYTSFLFSCEGYGSEQEPGGRPRDLWVMKEMSDATRLLLTPASKVPKRCSLWIRTTIEPLVLPAAPGALSSPSSTQASSTAMSSTKPRRPGGMQGRREGKGNGYIHVCAFVYTKAHAEGMDLV